MLWGYLGDVGQLRNALLLWSKPVGKSFLVCVSRFRNGAWIQSAGAYKGKSSLVVGALTNGPGVPRSWFLFPRLVVCLQMSVV
jgi:hypothetical protein